MEKVLPVDVVQSREHLEEVLPNSIFVEASTAFVATAGYQLL